MNGYCSTASIATTTSTIIVLQSNFADLQFTLYLPGSRVIVVAAAAAGGGGGGGGRLSPGWCSTVINKTTLYNNYSF